MRKIMTVVVVLTVLLAGCSFGGSSGTPTAGTNTTAATSNTLDASAVPGVTGTNVTNVSALASAYGESIINGPVDFRTTMDLSPNATILRIETVDYRFRNDTEQQLFELNNTNSEVTYFIDGEKAAARNESSGEVRYSNATNRVGGEAYFSTLYAGISLNYIPILEWEVTGTTTVDGETHYVLESNAVNETVLQRPSSSLSAENVDSADGRLVAGADGVIHSGSVTIDGNKDIAVTFSMSKDEGMDVTAPGWYDESQAS
ncbi:hypothetical protein NDI56_08630 [Haloarcula sp. S1CR25-12]|uniref:Uncharacterized protein n=1 Tax=Haloarcula saliterrae TaxID=2950534 RepID=A0ABU2FC91_9EURY|nr:hypothetical protein [Haloarcula sp. S1CR25-12]MDS0259456.1 hypothetical protein [Haloarcula sp. S1CR25-12]